MSRAINDIQYDDSASSVAQKALLHSFFLWVPDMIDVHGMMSQRLEGVMSDRSGLGQALLDHVRIMGLKEKIGRRVDG